VRRKAKGKEIIDRVQLQSEVHNKKILVKIVAFLVFEQKITFHKEQGYIIQEK